MFDISVLDNLPEISVLKDQDITLESMQAEMVADFEQKKTQLTGEECTLVPTDDRRMLLDAVSGELYLLAQIIDLYFKQNFIKYMFGDSLKNWGGNLGCFQTGEEAATCILKFTLSAAQPNDVVIPAGTRATAGDDIFFAVDEDITIPTGQTEATADATCTEVGTKGNDYIIGKINIIADPVAFVETVENTTATKGGHDEYTDDELREVVLNWPNTYSVAGPVGAYETMAREYSTRIADARCITTKTALVQIYIMLNDAIIPPESYCKKVEDYILKQLKNPGTDRISVLAPAQTEYTIEATYYISRENEEAEDGIKAAIEDAANEFVANTAAKIGGAINPGTLISYAMAAGAKRIEIKSPTYTAIGQDHIGICTDVKLTYGGLEDE